MMITLGMYKMESLMTIILLRRLCLRIFRNFAEIASEKKEKEKIQIRKTINSQNHRRK